MIAVFEGMTVRTLLLIAAVLIAFAGISTSAQELPSKIRGYKLHKAKISVKTDISDQRKDGTDAEALVKIDTPQLTDLSLSGITFELGGTISAIDQSGTVDFLTFHDFRVNGLSVEVAEYQNSFDFKKNEPVSLPKPFEIFLSTKSAAKGFLNELRESKPKWHITGRVFVFGKFKKSIFKFKRVVPVEIDLMIDNPLKNEKTEADK